MPQYLLDKQSPRAEDAPKFQVTNVNAHSLGVEGIAQETLRKDNIILIPRNTSLPARYNKTFVTRSDNQKTIVVQVLEGESSRPKRVCADRTGRYPQSARGPGQGPSGRGYLRVRQQRLPEGRRRRARHRGPRYTGARTRRRHQFPRAGSLETTHRALRPDSTPSRRWWPKRWPKTKPTRRKSTRLYNHNPHLLPLRLCRKSRSHSSMPKTSRRPTAAISHRPLMDTVSEQIAEEQPKRSNGSSAGGWVLALFFYLTSVVVGLGLGYLFLSMWDPVRFPRPW